MPLVAPSASERHLEWDHVAQVWEVVHHGYRPGITFMTLKGALTWGGQTIPNCFNRKLLERVDL